MSGVLDNENILRAVICELEKDALAIKLAKQIRSEKTWGEMAADERQVCVRAMVAQAASQEELRERLTELSPDPFCIDWSLAEPDDRAGQEERMLVKIMGGLVASNGALVIIWATHEKF